MCILRHLRRLALPLLSAVRIPLLIALLAAGAARAQDAPELLLEVRIERHLLSDAINAYQQDGDVLLPLGEMARLLTIAIRANPAEGQASGYILDEQRGFRLDLGERVVVRNGERQPFDPRLVRRHADDIYVASALLARWLPVDFEIDMASLLLKVRPREKLPLQARLERQGKSLARPGAAGDPAYTRVATPYRLARMPFADQTVGVDLRRGAVDSARTVSYTAYLTGDLLGAEAALYINSARAARGPAARLTLGRQDPDAMLLGPLRARTVQVGSVPGAGVPHIALGSANGNGFLVSNRALGLPDRFDRHNLQGDLPPGWDVELYFNGALIGFQQARADGRYSFDDQPLIYGANQFRLVFHGPLGQVRIERHTFLLEQSMLAPGQFDYSVSAQRDDQGRERSAALFDWGVGRRLTASAALMRMPLHGQARNYASLALQGYFDNLILTAAAVRADDGGRLAQLGVKSRIGALAVSASRAVAHDFVSDFYLPAGDPVRLRDELRVDGMLGPLPVSLQARRDRLASNLENLELNARISAYRSGTAVSHALRWQSLGGVRHADGQLAASRRVAGIGVSGQLQYSIEPQARLATLALSADKHLAGGYLLGAGLTRTFVDPHCRFSASLKKSLGRFGMGLHGWYAQGGGYGGGLQLFMALGRDPRSAHWMRDAAPMAGSGSASPRVFLDTNRNGVMDGADTPIAGAGFLVNGASQLARTGADGVAWLGRLVPSQHADIALDPATLEDPQWQPAAKGMRIVPRPGTVAELEFAVALTGEIDGTAYLLEKGVQRPAADFEIELVDAAQAVVAHGRSGADGYFILSGIAPGSYQLRIAPAQLKRLGLQAPAARALLVDQEANFINGQDFVVTRQ